MGKQRDLFRPDPYDDDEVDLTPKDPHFDRDFIPATEALFRVETSDVRTRSNTPCPFRVGKVERTLSLTLTCECPESHALVKRLGSGIPRCSERRCPVRIVLWTADR
jgi:hypothetical protein